jgi:tRNA/tmRNA/rRNA uracil-C5-methylase (TrmA/RlmC/RlmD family)
VTTGAASAPQAGDVLELTAGEVVHGGWCVSRQDDTGRVIFVRHALPGERVLATVTQATARFARADATEILRPSADRVTPPCPYARPGGCGGCDWQHASLPAQRALKAAVIRQQLSRIGGIDTEVEVEVEALDGDEDGLGWRTVVSFAVDAAGMAGLRKHRSHEIVEIERCLIAHELVTAADVTGTRWPGAQSVEVSIAPATGERGLLVTGPAAGDALREIAADSIQVVRKSGARTPVRGRSYLTQRAAGREWRVSLGSFWQVHPGAADALAAAVLGATNPRPGETALDLYCGAGLFAGILAEAVGPDGAVIAIEQDSSSVRDARHNLRAFPWARVHRGDVAAVLRKEGLGDASIAVLDPPRAGASRPVIDALCGRAGSRAPGSALRRIAYVSCDPATLARDLRLLLDAGWQLAGLRGYDAFPMTHHVECVATLIRA